MNRGLVLKHLLTADMPLYAGLSRQPCETHHGDNQNQGRDAKKAFYYLKEPI